MTAKTTLDLVIVSDITKVKVSGVLDVSIADHKLVYESLNLKKKRPPPQLATVRTYKDLDINSFKRDIQNAPWWVCLTFEETDDVTQAWSKMYDSIVEEHVKTRKAKICKDSLPWVDGQMRKLMNKRCKLLKQCDGTEKTSAQWTEYRKVKNKVTKMMRQAEAKYWHDQFSEAASTQDFWKTYWKATKKTRITPG